MMYNSSIVSFYTPEVFPFATASTEQQYTRYVFKGEKHALQSRCIVTALVRDVADRLPEIKKKAERVGALFADYRILIVENDSSDGTRKLLLEWSRENPKVSVLGCGINVEECSLPKMPKTDGHQVDRGRIEKMVTLRNIYLDHIKTEYPDFDYVVMWDLDMIGNVYLDGIQNTLGWLAERPEIDVVCAYGIYRWGLFTLFYDTYALLHLGEKFHIDLKTIHDIRKGIWEAKYSRGDPLVPVDSCFSGFAVYRVSGLLGDGVIYDMSGEDNLECEHVRLNVKIKGRKVINPSMINLVLLND